MPQPITRKKARISRHPPTRPHSSAIVEGEVGLALGQVIEMALGAVEITLAEDATRSDRDLRLADVIARAKRVAFGIEEDQHAIALIIVVDEIDRERHSDRKCQRPADRKSTRLNSSHQCAHSMQSSPLKKK